MMNCNLEQDIRILFYSYKQHTPLVNQGNFVHADQLLGGPGVL